MNDPQKQQLIDWLNDAYSTERKMAQRLEKQVGHFDNVPEIQKHLQEEIKTSQNHSQQLKNRITALGGSPSEAQSLISEIIGDIGAGFSGDRDDKIVKDAVADMAGNTYEAGLYRTISIAAEQVGDKETAQMVKSIIGEEAKSNQWYESKLPQIVQNHLESLKAKR